MDLEVADPLGWTALHAAVAWGHEDCARLLLEHRAPVNVRAIDGWTPLGAAAANGSTSMISLLLEHGARADEVLFTTSLPAYHKTGDGRAHWTAFSLAASGGHVDAMRLLEEAGSPGERRDVAHYLFTPLQRAGRTISFSEDARCIEDEHDEHNPPELIDEVWSVDGPISFTSEMLKPLARFGFNGDPIAELDSMGCGAGLRFVTGAPIAKTRFDATGHFDDWRWAVAVTPMLADQLYQSAPIPPQAHRGLLRGVVRRGDVRLVRWLLEGHTASDELLALAAENGLPRVLEVLLAAGGAPVDQWIIRQASWHQSLASLRVVLKPEPDAALVSSAESIAADAKARGPNPFASELVLARLRDR